MELLVVAVFAVVFVGPQKLPTFFKQAGRFFVQVRRYSSDMRGQINMVLREAEDEIRMEEVKRNREKLQEQIAEYKAEFDAGREQLAGEVKADSSGEGNSWESPLAGLESPPDTEAKPAVDEKPADPPKSSEPG